MKKYNNIFLALWMQYDKEFWSELRDIERQFLLGLIVKGETIEEISKKYNVDLDRIKLIFEAILMRVERTMGRDISGAIRQGYALNRASKRVGTNDLEVGRIYLN